jgi:RHS repeat-associated protein
MNTCPVGKLLFASLASLVTALSSVALSAPLSSVVAQPANASSEDWYAYDSNGNVTLLTDAEAKPTAHYEYDAFGKTIAATGPAAETNTYRFSTKPIEDSSGLAFYGYRYYSPELGRWPSKDPIEERAGANVYAAFANAGVGECDMLGKYVISNDSFPNSARCDGKGGFKTVIQEDLSSIDVACGIPTCVRMHERSHVADVEAVSPGLCVNQPVDATVGYSSNAEAIESEKRAYWAELGCYLSKRFPTSGTGVGCSTDCKTALDNAIRDTEQALRLLMSGVLP